MRIEFDIKGLVSYMKVAAQKSFDDRVREKIHRATRAAAIEMQSIVIENMQGQYSLKELADMDHPYSTKHERIQIKGQEPYVINKQSGKIIRSLRVRNKNKRRKSVSYELFFDRRISRYAPYVLLRTKKMHHRDLLGRSLDNPISRKRILSVMRSNF